ncbi:MAG: hypothetical protein GF398_11015 [Chitinivibrionales bacterium]|nr:hypothetical protein [Chitinivibrionales bacterium]
MSTMNITLIGFTSSGKSATGLELAALIGAQYVDLDEQVEQIHLKLKGQPMRCREIYSMLGRDCFTSYEHIALNHLLGQHNLILSTGGGTPLDEKNHKLLKQFGKIIYLKPAPEVIMERMRSKGFPQFMQDNPTLKHVEDLCSERNPVYERVADVVIDNTSQSPRESAASICKKLRIPAISHHSNTRSGR